LMVDKENVDILRLRIEGLVSDLCPHLMILDAATMVKIATLREKSHQTFVLQKLESMIKELEDYLKMIPIDEVH